METTNQLRQPPSTWPNAWPHSTASVQLIDISEGTRFGKLTVIKRAANIGKNRSFLCECDCGKFRVVQARYLRLDKIKSCGCAKGKTTQDGHKLSKHPLYQVWKNMTQRTTNNRHSGYAGCGALGVKVCEKWRNSFENFLADMSPRPPNTMLCRLRQGEDYTPENTVWLTAMARRAQLLAQGIK